MLKCYGGMDDETAVSTPWQTALLNRLTATPHTGGGWGYRTSSSSSAEPTSLSCLALSTYAHEPNLWARGLSLLDNLQQSDGGVPVSSDAQSPCWPTGLSILAWNTQRTDGEDPFSMQVHRAAQWLVAARGGKVPLQPELYGHDSRLQGWSWVAGTHSWLEPTAYGVLGLKSAGMSDHVRTREGVALLWDRMFSGGGWNYGNTRVLGKTLRPFPATTGIVLSALAGETSDETIHKSVAYLTRELGTVRSPMSLGWGLIGLSAWNARPDQADHWLAESAADALTRDGSPLEDSLLLLAGADSHPLNQRERISARHSDE